MPAKPNHLELLTLPGHLARRVHQLAVAMYGEEVRELRLTPIQYATLQGVCNQPGIDQKTLAHTIGIDASTAVGVLDRLEARGLVVRVVPPTDRRTRLIQPTAAGIDMLSQALPRVLKSQERMLAALSHAEAKEFMRLMNILVDSNEELSTVPAKS